MNLQFLDFFCHCLKNCSHFSLPNVSTYLAYLKNAHIFLCSRKVGFEVERSIESTLLRKRRSGSTRFLPKTTFVQMEKRLSERLDAANLAGAAIITSSHWKAEALNCSYFSNILIL